MTSLKRDEAVVRSDCIRGALSFTMKNCGGEYLRKDKRRKIGIPLVNKANFGQVLHIIHYLGTYRPWRFCASHWFYIIKPNWYGNATAG